MREIVLDTETTGLDPASGHRVVEIACIELINRMPTGNHYQVYINPERNMPDEAFRVHGLSDEFLRTHPVFADQADGFLEFVGDGALVIHNAEFDLKFLNAELERLNRPGLENHEVTDTVQLARRKFPGAPANLDALCRRFGIDNSARTVHGALLDAELLAEVYLELMGGRQPGLGLGGNTETSTGETSKPASSHAARVPRAHEATAEERRVHDEFLATLKTPIWNS